MEEELGVCLALDHMKGHYTKVQDKMEVEALSAHRVNILN
jgi:hypothetical protein